MTQDGASTTRVEAQGLPQVSKTALIQFFKDAGYEDGDAVVRAGIASGLFSPRNIEFSLVISMQERVRP